MLTGLLKGKPVIEIKCENCGCSHESRYNRGQLIKYHREFGEYENLVSDPCHDCGQVTVINLNLPREELEDDFFNAVEMPEDERQERRVLKDFMSNELIFEEVT